MKISILIPCHNEEKFIRHCLESCFGQTRPADEILVVDDGSTDQTPQILAEFGDKIKVVTIARATGNKSYAQELGLTHITGDIFAVTDGDTILDKDFLKRVEIDFLNEPEIAAVGGYVKSIRNNWLTACRELDYIIGQDLYKFAQSIIGHMFVIPGCAGAFRTDIFKKYIRFEHDTITEDLDFTYKLHDKYLKIKFDRRAISWTQDPATLHSYVNQMRRWLGGGWQNLLKHLRLVSRPTGALILSMMYLEGLAFSLFLILLPLFNIILFIKFVIPYLFFSMILGVYGAISHRRLDLLIFWPLHPFVVFLNAVIFLEQFFKVVILKRKVFGWFTPERIVPDTGSLRRKGILLPD